MHGHGALPPEAGHYAAQGAWPYWKGVTVEAEAW
jgi:hypothetical protein